MQRRKAAKLRKGGQFFVTPIAGFLSIHDSGFTINAPLWKLL
jgi:hypothetical protein